MKTALKEWAVAVEAIARGEQVVLVRKGGIREDAREFRVEYDRFLFYPTYEHQRDDLVQQQFRSGLAEALAAWPGPATVTFKVWAEVTDSVAVTDETAVALLAPYYVYTESYAEERLRWRPRKPLQVLVIRAYHLAAPVTLPAGPEYGGCRSWVTLDQEIDTAVSRPVLDDATFGRLRDDIRRLLAGSPSLTR